jgi:hypothetical protein
MRSMLHFTEHESSQRLPGSAESSELQGQSKPVHGDGDGCARYFYFVVNCARSQFLHRKQVRYCSERRCDRADDRRTMQPVNIRSVHDRPSHPERRTTRSGSLTENTQGCARFRAFAWVISRSSGRSRPTLLGRPEFNARHWSAGKTERGYLQELCLETL